jgi:hypothetical protein
MRFKATLQIFELLIGQVNQLGFRGDRTPDLLNESEPIFDSPGFNLIYDRLKIHSNTPQNSRPIAIPILTLSQG